MWSDKKVFKVVTLLVCSLSLAGCWGGKGKKTQPKSSTSALYNDQKAGRLSYEDGPHSSTVRIPFEQTIYYFRLNSDELDSHAKSWLYNVAQQLKKHSEANIVLDGHADARGPDSFNELLAQKRADSVKAYLMYQGIDEGRIKAYGHSNNQLAVSGNSEASHAKNRRVKLRFVE